MQKDNDMRVVQNPLFMTCVYVGHYVNFIESKHAKHDDRVSNAVVCVRECVSLRVFWAWMIRYVCKLLWDIRVKNNKIMCLPDDCIQEDLFGWNDWMQQKPI